MASDRRPILCLITDRRRLCPTCEGEAAVRCLLAQIQEAVACGVNFVQIREREMSGDALAGLVAASAAIARGSGTRIVVNDRLDVALAAGADGVHLRADSVPVSAARRIAPAGFLIGRSVHDAAEAASAGAGADYLIAGPVFPTSSKPGAVRLLGAEGLDGVVRAARQPVLAIGGMTLDRLPMVAAAGGAGIAAIGLFLAEDRGLPCRSDPFRESVLTYTRAFPQ